MRTFYKDKTMLFFKLFSSQKMEGDKSPTTVFISKTSEDINTSHVTKTAHRRCKNVVLATIVLIVILSLSFNIVFLVSYTKQQKNDAGALCKTGEKENEVCLNCKYFEDNARFWRQADSPDFGRGKSKGEKDVCCFQYTDSIHEQNKIFFMEHMTSDQYHANDSARPAAHLTLNPVDITDAGVRLRWYTGSQEYGEAFMKHVDYADDTIVILEPGLYYVYSFITFRSKQFRDNSFLNHYIYRQRSKRAEMIFMDKQKRQKGDLEYQTSMLAGIVNLQSRDKIFTDVSDRAAVYKSPLTNYMGLFKL